MKKTIIIAAFSVLACVAKAQDTLVVDSVVIKTDLLKIGKIITIKKGNSGNAVTLKLDNTTVPIIKKLHRKRCSFFTNV